MVKIGAVFIVKPSTLVFFLYIFLIAGGGTGAPRANPCFLIDVYGVHMQHSLIGLLFKSELQPT